MRGGEKRERRGEKRERRGEVRRGEANSEYLRSVFTTSVILKAP